MTNPIRYQDLERALGYNFNDRDLLLDALTHASARSVAGLSVDNERLEFLGDRVLGLVVAKLLLERFPGDVEGDLARRFNRLVRRETCAEIGLQLELGRYLRLGNSESGSGGRRKRTIIANACEAILGAAFLDGGYQQAEALIMRHWSPLLKDVEHIQADAKSALQEWAQGRGLPLPIYEEMERTGPDHAPIFVTKVSVVRHAAAHGEGRSKRVSEQAAARAFLEREGIMAPELTD
ncbi:MAG: ribonuclease III [Pseudomonadota bacterium]